MTEFILNRYFALIEKTAPYWYLSFGCARITPVLVYTLQELFFGFLGLMIFEVESCKILSAYLDKVMEFCKILAKKGKTKIRKVVSKGYISAQTCEPVAQLDRAPVCGTGGRTFESYRAHQFWRISL